MSCTSLVLVVLGISVVPLQCNANEIKPEDHPGHLKSFGSSGPFFDIPVVDKFPTTTEFFNQYVIPSIPLVIKGGAKLSPAYTKWTDEYFISHPGASEKIFAEGRKKEVRTLPGFDLEFSEFVSTYKEKDMYMVSSTPKFMRPDILLPPPLACEHVISLLSTEVMWFSSGGTISHLHNDDVDNINCLFRGRKKLVFVNPHDFKDVEWYNKVLDIKSGSYSNMDVESVNYARYPQLIDTRYAVVTMEEGDCLFIPYKWPHQVNSFGPSNLAANVWFSHLKEGNLDIDEDLCGKMNNVTLDELPFEDEDNEEENKQTRDYKGEEIPNMAEFSEQMPLFYYMLKTIKHRKPLINFEDFKTGMNKVVPNGVVTINKDCDNYLKSMFDMVDVNENNFIDKADYKQIAEMGKENIVKYAKGFKEMTEIYHDLVILVQFQVGKNMTRSLVTRGDISAARAALIFGENYLTELDINIKLKDEL